ncbi:uncharacterized protein [Primulina huaijiensis]|uniref:uncharacterized protein n=1 Tax=Primulina huaijiensis TaxID=1492673 RepID=UPI003CC7843C
MDTGSSSCNVIGKGKKTDKSRRVWSRTEEEVLLEALKDLATKGWKSENGFRCGYLALLEETMNKVFPRTDLRANPHINSKIHVWKRTHGSLVTILSRSGIGWNNSEKKIEASDEAWECFVKGDSSARSMCYKSWPYYSDWCEIFGHDRATGANSLLFAEVSSRCSQQQYRHESRHTSRIRRYVQ